MINSRAELINYLKLHPPNWKSKRYLEWTKPDPGFKKQLEKVGEIKDEKYVYDYDEYWGENAPIDFSKYPYSHVEIYKLKDFNNLYFNYKELGGHMPEDRIRLIRKELIK